MRMHCTGTEEEVARSGRRLLCSPGGRCGLDQGINLDAQENLAIQSVALMVQGMCKQSERDGPE